jgi:hypothetical protein
VDPTLERAHLAEADRLIDDGIRRIDRQKQLVQKLRPGGYGLHEAERLLALLQKSLAIMQTCRSSILRELERNRPANP